jgi:signal transduction histidine kinase
VLANALKFTEKDGKINVEIEIIKKNNITIIESNSNKRFKVMEFNSTTNFC